MVRSTSYSSKLLLLIYSFGLQLLLEYFNSYSFWIEVALSSVSMVLRLVLLVNAPYSQDRWLASEGDFIASD